MQLEVIASHPITSYLGEETNTHLTTTSFQVVVEGDKLPLRRSSSPGQLGCSGSRLLGRELREMSWESLHHGLAPSLQSCLCSSPRSGRCLSDAAAASEPGHIPHWPSPSWRDLGAALSRGQAGAPRPCAAGGSRPWSQGTCCPRLRRASGRGRAAACSSRSGLAILGPVPEQAPECSGRASFYKLLLHFITRSLFSSPLFLQTDDCFELEGFFPLELDWGHSTEWAAGGSEREILSVLLPHPQRLIFMQLRLQGISLKNKGQLITHLLQLPWN